MSKITKTCLNCNINFETEKREHNRGHAKFCCQPCSSSYNNKIKTTVENICRQCSRLFNTSSKNALYCSNICKQRNYRNKSKTETSIKTLYKKFSHLPCQICGWQDAPRDVHHILPVSKGGKNEEYNLITLCPNHHRMVHSELITETELKNYKTQ